jgi:hypothetical protein
VVIVSVPPDILDYPTSTDMVVREGSNVTLRCAATGTPEPTVTWRRETGGAIRHEGTYFIIADYRRCTSPRMLRSSRRLVDRMTLRLSLPLPLDLVPFSIAPDKERSPVFPRAIARSFNPSRSGLEPVRGRTLGLKQERAVRARRLVSR